MFSVTASTNYCTKSFKCTFRLISKKKHILLCNSSKFNKQTYYIIDMGNYQLANY